MTDEVECGYDYFREMQKIIWAMAVYPVKILQYMSRILLTVLQI